ncbi:hypothetical protein [Virgisporangium ochraceum]|uniref:Exo-alpha-sialidase n=1 Tax=Virgisporangium ochraceum TaxID=65505 RepID=A0A8J4EDW1_9ACTN|nr:hypothetical protein [Virgisporangium ochraceum]GIJ71081.1 hypothetical protein Voc01_059980 [Virgisporangium ochraceum]
MPEGHFALLREYADDVARQPDFDTIRRRAVRVRRRRRHTVSSVVAGVTALVVAAVGLSVGPDGGGRKAGPAPTPTTSPGFDPDAGWPRWTAVVAARADELYTVVERCRACGSELLVSADGGRTWTPRATPPRPDDRGTEPRTVALTPLAPGVLMWSEAVTVNLPDLLSSGSPGASIPPGVERNWVTLDGGRTWRRPTIAEQPVAAVPAGTRPVDCAALREEKPCPFYAVDPATGRFARLANQPTGFRYEGWWSAQTDVPVGGHLWIPGLDPATLKPAVASSTDGGATWTTHVFAGGVSADDDGRGVAGKYLPTVAAGTGTTAHALIYSADDRLAPYRTTDGGRTWEPVPGGVLPDVPDAGFVTADGAHVVKCGDDFRASRDGGPYAPVTLAGYPAALRMLTQVTSRQATGRYVVTSGDLVYVSDDGWSWRGLTFPA